MDILALPSFFFQIQFLVVIPLAPCIKSNTGLAPIIKSKITVAQRRWEFIFLFLTIWAWIVSGYYDFLLGAKLTPVLLLCYPILNIHLPFHDLGAIPALLSPQLQSSQWKEGSGEKRRPYSFLLRTWLRSCTHDFCLHPIGQNLVTWFRHTREVGKCSPYSGYPFAQLKSGLCY